MGDLLLQRNSAVGKSAVRLEAPWGTSTWSNSRCSWFDAVHGHPTRALRLPLSRSSGFLPCSVPSRTRSHPASHSVCVHRISCA